MKPQKNIYNYLLLATIFLFGACSKMEDYGRRPSAYVNFYNAAEVLQQNGNQQNNNMVYINDSVSNQAYSSKNFPIFSPTYAVTTVPRQYPLQTTDGPTGSIVVLPTAYQYMYYMALKPDSYRFIFTGNDKVFWQETKLTLAENSLTQLYLTEDIQQNQYRIVAVPDERTGIPGKVRVQVVHLSADTEPLQIARLTVNSNTGTPAFPTPLTFGSYSEYVALDTTGASKQFNQIVLQLSPASTPNQGLLTVSIPAEAGGSFTVLICGLRNEAKRSAITGHGAGGQPVFTDYTVNANLRTVVRRNY